MEKKYGRSVVDDLESIAGPHKWTQEELRELRTYYRDKIKSIEQGLDPRASSNTGMEMSNLFANLGEAGEMS